MICIYLYMYIQIIDRCIGYSYVYIYMFDYRHIYINVLFIDELICQLSFLERPFLRALLRHDQKATRAAECGRSRLTAS